MNYVTPTLLNDPLTMTLDKFNGHIHGSNLLTVRDVANHLASSLEQSLRIELVQQMVDLQKSLTFQFEQDVEKKISELQKTLTTNAERNVNNLEQTLVRKISTFEKKISTDIGLKVDDDMLRLIKVIEKKVSTDVGLKIDADITRLRAELEKRLPDGIDSLYTETMLYIDGQDTDKNGFFKLIHYEPTDDTKFVYALANGSVQSYVMFPSGVKLIINGVTTSINVGLRLRKGDRLQFKYKPNETKRFSLAITIMVPVVKSS